MAAIAAAVAGVLGGAMGAMDGIASDGRVAPTPQATLPGAEQELGNGFLAVAGSPDQGVSEGAELGASVVSSTVLHGLGTMTPPPDSPPATLLGSSSVGGFSRCAANQVSAAGHPAPCVPMPGCSTAASPAISMRDGRSLGPDGAACSPGTASTPAPPAFQASARGQGSSSSSSGHVRAGSTSGSCNRGAGGGICSPLPGLGCRSSGLRPEATGTRHRQQLQAGVPVVVGLSASPVPFGAARGVHALVSPRLSGVVAVAPLPRSVSPPPSAEAKLRSLSPCPGAPPPSFPGQGACGRSGPPAAPRLQALSPQRSSHGPPREARASTARRSVPRAAWLHP